VTEESEGLAASGGVGGGADEAEEELGVLRVKRSELGCGRRICFFGAAGAAGAAGDRGGAGEVVEGVFADDGFFPVVDAGALGEVVEVMGEEIVEEGEE
jgi:hypothetical protein